MSTNAPAAKAPVKSVLNESKQIERAAMLIQMGARMQVLESETTLSYERLIRQDKAEAVFRLGLNEEAADILASLSAAQVLKLASRNTLLCSFRVDDNLVWSLLTNHTAKKVGNEATNTLHANILMASRVSEVL